MLRCLWTSHCFISKQSQVYRQTCKLQPSFSSSNLLLDYRAKYIHTHIYLSTKINKEDRIILRNLTLKKLATKMDVSLLSPPPTVKGMTELDRDAFQKKIKVPHVIVKSSRVQCALKHLKQKLLKLEKLKPIQCEKDHEKKVLLLNPLLVSNYEDIKDEFIKAYGDDAEFEHREITLQYENWKALEALKAILPENQDNVQSYSIIGHILHLNLRDHLLPYKSIIGQVFLDKLKNVSLVVNKTKNIDSTYRNFQMEVLAGSGDTNVIVKEDGCTFTMDFARVYWNPRLSTEHERIVKKLKHGDVLYDVMAGIGPFAIPAGKKKCLVLANDLNPYSHEALVKNCSINKVTERVKCFNLDGHEFIKTVLKKDLLDKWEDVSFTGEMHITMNLPAMAVEFLPSFVDLFNNTDNLPDNLNLPVIHVYMFTKEDNKNIAIGMVAEKLGFMESMNTEVDNGETPEDNKTKLSDGDNINNDKEVSATPEGVPVINQEEVNDEDRSKFNGFRKHVTEVLMVRNVAPNKSMMRVSFQLSRDLLIGDNSVCEEPPIKKVKAT